MAHTTVSIEKSIFKRSAERAKTQHLSVSAVARMLLDAYAKGRINIMAIQASDTVDLEELQYEDLSQGDKRAADKAYNANSTEMMNI